ncbi:strumpellin and WASH-interacting protein [Oratosquilla oratoria]|uniref:strumpellin and WASH-interacting protein n=1 Tax=Oratosquilla oratoria TaxID=337810 RepID=UPI003F7730A7
MSQDWRMTVGVDYEEDSHKAVGEKELKRFGSIVEEHGDQLANIIEALGPHPAPAWDPFADPIMVQLEPFEQTELFTLVRSDNKRVNKVVLALGALCSEIDFLLKEARNDLYPPIIYYGEGVEESGESGEMCGESQACLARMLPTLHRIACYVRRVVAVSLNVVRQLGVLYSPDRKSQVVLDVSGVNLQVVYSQLGFLLGTLITLDELVANNSILHEHWGAYRRFIRQVAMEPQRFQLESKQIKPVEKLLSDIEGTVMHSNMFQTVMNQRFDTKDVEVMRNGSLREEMMTVLHGWCGQIEQSASESWWCDYQIHVVGLTALVLLHHALFNSADKKIFKGLLNLYKKIPCVTLAGMCVWLGERYIVSTVPSLNHIIDKKTIDAHLNHRVNYLAQKVAGISKEAQNYNLQVCGWIVGLDAAAKRETSQMKNQDFSQRAALLLQGLILAQSIRYTVQSVLNLHTALGRPMGKACALSVGRLVETLKAIEHTYHRHSTILAESLPLIHQNITYQILAIIGNTKNRVLSEKRLSEQRLDIISAFSIVEQIFSGPGTKKRRVLGRVALSIANQGRVLKEEDLSTLQVLLRRYDLASDVQSCIREATDCSLLYHHRVIVPTYLQDLFQNRVHVHRIHFMLAAVSNCSIPLQKCAHLADADDLIRNFEEDMYEAIKVNILDKVCKEVETELRLSTHSHLQLDDRNPYKTPLKDLKCFIRLKAMVLFNTVIDVKSYIERYLEKTFYALTVVAPHDWRTYEEMRNLALVKYELKTIDSHLPSHTLDQGVDVLEIMRNIHIFVQHYMYNLNQQFFVEATSNNKHLSTVTIKHIANSIRTHGAGIINTTVNFTYQFLRRKFHVFSQFLYDEQIKSRLLKDMQHWREVKATNDYFPYERAEKFNRGIRKLGLTPDGLSYLDKFRGLITHIGNAMGYVRLVRSGGLHCASNAAWFIPDLEDIASFTQLCEEAPVCSETKKAAENLDEVINNITKSFNQDMDYFKLLVDVFAPPLRDTKNSHLRNFFLIIPPLTINYIEHSITAKDNMNKKNKLGAFFTDDGFAMGIAYLLKVLNQSSSFDHLHWWSGVRRRFIAEREKVEKQKQGSSALDDKLQQTLALSLSRLQQYQQEFELLYLSISSARIFFKGDCRSNDTTKGNSSSDAASQGSSNTSDGTEKKN